MNGSAMRVLVVFFILVGTAGTCTLWAQSSTVIGYAVVSPGPGSTPGLGSLRVFETFGFQQGSVAGQSETPAAQMTTTALLFVNISRSLGRDTGVAIANPDVVSGQLTLTLTNDIGVIVTIKTIIISSRQQISTFVSQLFADRPVPAEFTGTLAISSSIPVAVVALRFRGPAFTVETPSGLSSPTPVPQIIPGVGSNDSFIFPNFVVGGGWSSQIVVINTGSTPTSVRVDLFSSGGNPMTATLNGITASTFVDFPIRAFGVVVISPPEAVSPF